MSVHFEGTTAEVAADLKLSLPHFECGHESLASTSSFHAVRSDPLDAASPAAAPNDSLSSPLPQLALRHQEQGECSSLCAAAPSSTPRLPSIHKESAIDPEYIDALERDTLPTVMYAVRSRTPVQMLSQHAGTQISPH
jgi:hypothetical protein